MRSAAAPPAPAVAHLETPPRRHPDLEGLRRRGAGRKPVRRDAERRHSPLRVRSSRRSSSRRGAVQQAWTAPVMSWISASPPARSRGRISGMAARQDQVCGLAAVLGAESRHEGAGGLGRGARGSRALGNGERGPDAEAEVGVDAVVRRVDQRVHVQRSAVPVERGERALLGPGDFAVAGTVELLAAREVLAADGAPGGIVGSGGFGAWAGSARASARMRDGTRDGRSARARPGSRPGRNAPAAALHRGIQQATSEPASTQTRMDRVRAQHRGGNGDAAHEKCARVEQQRSFEISGGALGDPRELRSRSRDTLRARWPTVAIPARETRRPRRAAARLSLRLRVARGVSCFRRSSDVLASAATV